MKLTVALVALSSPVMAFLPPLQPSRDCMHVLNTGRNTCTTVQMKADGEAGGVTPIVGQQQPMGRKQVLQSIAASGFGAILFAASPSVADTAVDYAKVGCFLCLTHALKCLLGCWMQHCP